MARLGPCTVVPDPDPDHPVKSPLRTYLACLRSFPRGNATHLLIVQDDTWPCDDFRSKAEEFIAEHDPKMCALFMPGAGAPGAAVRRALKRSLRVAELPVTWTPTVALSWPEEAAQSFLSFASQYDPNITRGDDGPVGAWRLTTRWPVVAPIPSLVQHPDVVDSLFRGKGTAKAGRNRARVAARFEG